ncbi:MAG: hypothetical protein ACWA5U_08295 [bacterium]
MKTLISPPINLLLTTSAFGILGFAAWSMIDLKLTETKQQTETLAKVAIPDASALAVPPLQNYNTMIQQPLFWAERKPYVASKPEPLLTKKESATPIDKTFPEGRLIGIVDLGDSRMAVLKDQEKSHYLNLDDKWGNWKLSVIDKEQIVFSLGEEDKPLALIADYAAPKAGREATRLANTNHNQAKNIQQARRAAFANATKNPRPTNLPNTVNAQKKVAMGMIPKNMSIKEALAARQRLIAERWRNKNKPN